LPDACIKDIFETLKHLHDQTNFQWAVNSSILPGMTCKINPENSDFSVGNFLTKKGRFLERNGPTF